MDQEGSASHGIADILAGLDPAAAPRVVFVGRGPVRGGREPGTLLCLSASFNPLTTAHAGLIEEARRLLHPRETLLLLAVANVDKRIAGLPLEARLDLLCRFADRQPDVSVGVVAHGRFVDKLEAIRTAYPAGTRVVFLVGFDTLVRVFDAKYYTDRATALAALFRGSEFLVANRGADTPSVVTAFLDRPDVAPFAHRIRVVRLPEHLADISATDVRARLARGEAVTALVPPEISPSLAAWRRQLREP